MFSKNKFRELLDPTAWNIFMLIIYRLWCYCRRTPVGGPSSVNGLKSAASTLASIVSRQAFDIPRMASDSGGGKGHGDDRDIGGYGERPGLGGSRTSLPDIGSADGDRAGGGGATPVRRDSVDSAVRTRRDTPAVSGVRTRRGTPFPVRDPFGSPVTPQIYNGYARHHAGNARPEAVEAAAASG